MSFPKLTLKPGREKPIRNRHPWVFSGAVAGVEGNPQPGGLVDVCAPDGTPIARATFNSSGALTARVLTWNTDETPDADWVRRQVAASVERRRRAELIDDETACRLVFGESDSLPGVVVDQYAKTLVVMLSTPFADMHRSAITQTLVELLEPTTIYERSDRENRKREGLESSGGVLFGDEPGESVEFREGDCRYLADVRTGQKTGFFLDQRENRRRATAYAEGRSVLNLFSYSGAFGVAAMKGGATSALNVESQPNAIELGDRIAALNGVSDSWKSVEADVFQQLRVYRDAGRRFDMIVVDPPKFASSRSHQDRACRAYKDANLIAMRLLTPGGILATFSCTGLISPHLFGQVIAGSAMDAQRDVRVLEKLSQPSDHPILMTFPESEYLKGLILQVD